MSFPVQIGNAILANNSNAARDAILSSTAQRPSTDIRLLAQTRQGRGRLLVSGSYTGASDTIIEAEVVSTAGNTLRTSAPVVRGVGSGTLNVTGIASGAATQKLTFTLANPGDPADKARLDFYGVSLVAKTAGSAGNALELTVTRNLVTAELPYATLDDISAGTASWTGEQWNWGGVSEQNGGIPATAPRIQFEGFPQVHRAYKVWESGAWVHKIDPAPAYAIPKGTRLLAVTGGYSLDLSGETYTGITLYDVLSAISARSLLIDVDGVVAEDRAPGGMAVTDVPLRTDAHSLPAVRTTKNGKGGVSSVTVDATAPTENVTLTYLQSREWSVVGDVSNRIGTAQTGVPFASSVLGFTIDAIATEAEAMGKISAKAEFTTRADGEGYPSICFNPLKLGAKAVDRTITYTWSPRPPADCPCSGAAVGIISDKCLGLIGDDDMGTVPSTIKARYVALKDWAQELISQQADFQTTTNVAVARYDMDLIMGALAEFETALVEMADKPAGLTEWDIKFAALQVEMAVLGGVLDVVPTVASWEYTVGETYVSGNDVIATVTGITDNGVSVSAAYIQGDGGAMSPWLNSWPTSGTFTVTGKNGVLGPIVVTLAVYAGTSGDIYRVQTPAEVSQILRKYAVQMDHCRAVADILKKSEASTLGDGCWQDDPSATGWFVPDDPDLLPMFPNLVYISSTLVDGKAYSTQEFGLGPEVTCPDRLKYGDKIIVKIGNTASATGYAEGDTFVIPLVRGAAAMFAGGSDTDPTQTWAVASDVLGALPDWSYNPEAPTPYAGIINAALVPGGIAFESGDSITVSIEGGVLRWRRDGGAWTNGDLYASHALGDGLTLSAQLGASPSFVANDIWTYQAVATYGLDNLRQPRVGRAYAWDGAATTITINLGAVTACEIVAIAMHGLPLTATVTINGAAMTVRDGVIFDYTAGRTGSTLTLVISGAGVGASIGWVYAGQGWRPTVGASTISIERQFGLTRGQSINPAALYLGAGMGGELAWNMSDRSGLNADNADLLDALVRYVAAQGMESVIVVPDITSTNPRPALCVIDTDKVLFKDSYEYQRGDDDARISVSLPLRAVLA